MFTVIDAPTRGVQRVRPRMRNVGLVHLAAVMVLGCVMTFGALQGCGGDVAPVLPSGVVLTALIGLAGIVMVVRVPRATAVAPALAAGASLSLFGGALAGWVWLLSQPCVGNVLDREFVTLLLVTACTAAVLGTSTWLLVSRDELEPWYATRGVVIAAAAAASVLVIGIGFAFLVDGEGTASLVAAVGVAVPWAIAVAAMGWLRPSPAVAVVTPAALQAIWLLASSGS